MARYHLHRETIVPRPLAEVFSFFERPDNLAKITPARLGFVITSAQPIEMKPGAIIDYTIKLMGFRVHWQTLISEYDPPKRFADEQSKGPYKYWHHEHLFESIADGTKIIDHVEYELPFGILGRLVHFAFVRHELRRIFDYRQEVINRTFAKSVP